MYRASTVFKIFLNPADLLSAGFFLGQDLEWGQKETQVLRLYG